jgi:peptidoglycan hydrolase-like protein with peptidoglycan-binding domain
VVFPLGSGTLRPLTPGPNSAGGTFSMISIRASLAVVLSAAVLAVPALAARVSRPTTTGHSHKSHKIAKSHQLHGQREIDSNRVTQIQEALIREHYMSGEPSGKWDDSTAAAMQKFQRDQGWQTRLMPDSRALSKLGLGPDYSGAINAKDASFTPPPPVTTIPAEQSSGFATASGVRQ